MTAAPDNTVILTGLELGALDLPLEALQAAALAHARTHFQGRDVVNTATGWVIGFGRRGLNKTLHHGARRAHLQSIPALPALLVRAAWVGCEANRDADELRSIPLVHTFRGLLVIGADTFSARLIVKETNVGHRFYDHDVTELVAETSEPAGSNVVAGLPKEGATTSKPAGSPLRLPESGASFKSGPERL